MTQSEQLMLTNWKNAPYTAAQQAMTPRLVSCAPIKTEPPVPGAVTTLIGTQAACGTYNGIPMGGAFGREVVEEAALRGYDTFPTMQVDGRSKQMRWVTYDDGHTKTWGLNLARRKVGDWFAAKLASHYVWADGWHVDYHTPLAWLSDYRPELKYGVAGGQRFWDDYMDGFQYMLHRYRQLRGSQPTTILGQQWHNGRGIRDCFYLDGRYIEKGPWYWASGGVAWWPYHKDQLDKFAGFTRYPGSGAPLNVLEFRYLSQDEEYIPDLLTLTAATNSVISWGRDLEAGVGFPG